MEKIWTLSLKHSSSIYHRPYWSSFRVISPWHHGGSKDYWETFKKRSRFTVRFPSKDMRWWRCWPHMSILQWFYCHPRNKAAQPTADSVQMQEEGETPYQVSPLPSPQDASLRCQHGTVNKENKCELHYHRDNCALFMWLSPPPD